MAEKKIITKGTPPDLIEKDIANTRKEMSGTIGEIQERLSVEHWKAVAGETIREKVSAAASRGRELAARARESAQRFGRAARKNSWKAKDRVLQFMKDNPSAARVIAFELGAWTVIASTSLLSRKREKRMKKESGPTEYAKAKIMSIEEVEQKVERAALKPEEEFKKAA